MRVLKKRSKKLLALFSVLVIAISAVAFNVIADTMPKVSVSKVESSSRGDTISVDVNLDNIDSKEFAMLLATVKYDPDKLEIVNLNMSSIGLNGNNLNNIDQEAGEVALIYAMMEGESTYSGKLATLEFKIKDTAAGKQDLEIIDLAMSRLPQDGEAEGEVVATQSEAGYIFVDVPVEDVSLVNSNITLDMASEDKKNAKLEVSYTPEDTTDEMNLSFDVKDPEIVSVDAEGNLTALKNGNTTVEVSAFGQEFIANVEVMTSISDLTLSSDNLKGNQLSLNKGETETLIPTITPDNTTLSKDLIWESTNDDVVTVTDGVVEAVGAGVATITAKTVNDVTASITVIVNVPITSASLSDDDITLNKGNSQELSINLEPVDATFDDVTWVSDDPDIVSVLKDENDPTKATITALKGGTTQITAQIGTYNLTADVTVNVPIENFKVSENNITLLPTQEKEITTTVTPSDFTGDRTITWESDNDDIATVSNGLITAVKPGETVVRATIQGHEQTINVKVLIPIEEIIISNEELTVAKNATHDISVNINPVEAEESKVVSWKSSDASIVKVEKNDDDSTKATLTALKGGIATITATLENGMEAECVVTVYVDVDTFTVDKDSITIDKNKTATLTATITPSDATYQDIDWEIVDDTKAVIESTKDNTVTILAKAAGDTIITGTLPGGKEVSVPIRVEVPIDSVIINNDLIQDNKLNLTKGDTTTLTTEVGPSDTTKDKTVTYKSSDTKVVTVDSTTGFVTAVGGGHATISATAGDVTTTIDVYVEVPIEEFTINKDTAEVIKNQSIKLETTIGPSDTTEDTTITWESEDNDIATVDKDGKVTGKSQGTVKITGTLENGMQVECEVTVKIIPVDSISFDQKEITIKKNQTSILDLLVYPYNATEISSFTWVSDNEEVLKVDQNGKITALKPGVATITVYMDGLDDPATITVEVVEVPLESISIKNDLDNLQVGDIVDLEIGLNPGDTTDEVTFKYTSSNEGVVKIDENGRLTAVGKGDATITVTASNGVETSASVSVSAIESPNTGVKSIASYGISALVLLGGILITIRKVRA